MNVREININAVKTVENVRLNINDLEGMMQDIKQHGLKQAIGVVPTKSGEFIIVFGNRRLAACRKLGWKKIPANIYPEDMEIAEVLINNLGENIHRKDPSPLELGRLVDKLKNMELNESEIAVKLSIPKSRVIQALSLYNNLPSRHRKNVVYQESSKGKTGNIPATIAHKIISYKKSYGLSDAGVDRLLKVAKLDELTTADMYIVNAFLAQGLTVAQALENKKLFSATRVDVVVNNDEMVKLMGRENIDSVQVLLQAIIYGEIPPIKRPDFLKK